MTGMTENEPGVTVDDDLPEEMDAELIAGTDGDDLEDAVEGDDGADDLEDEDDADDETDALEDEDEDEDDGDDDLEDEDDDTVEGGDGDDELDGGDGDDTVIGGAGDDMLEGGDGDDALYGDEGDDILAGGAGADVLFGGEGHDMFVFDAETADEVDTIADYEPGEPVVLVGFNEGEVRLEQDGADVNLFAMKGDAEVQVATILNMHADDVTVIWRATEAA